MDNTQTLIEEWYKRVSVTQVAHYHSSDYFGKMKYRLGVPAIAFATFAGTTVFATLQQQSNIYLQVAIGLASVAAAVLVGLQTFMDYSERAEKHRVAGAKYGAIGRHLESMRSQPDTITNEALDRIRERLDWLAEESPNNSLKIYNRVGAKDLEITPARNPG